MMMAIDLSKGQVLRIDIDKGTNYRVLSVVLCEERRQVDFDVLNVERRHQGKIGRVARCGFRSVRFFFGHAEKAVTCSQGHSRSLHFGFDVMEAPVEGFVCRTVTKQVITTLILEDALELVTV